MVIVFSPRDLVDFEVQSDPGQMFVLGGWETSRGGRIHVVSVNKRIEDKTERRETYKNMACFFHSEVSFYKILLCEQILNSIRS